MLPLTGVVLGLATLLAYHNSLRVPFLFDDHPAIERNLTIRHLWPLSDALSPPLNAAGATGRPLVNLSLALNYAGGGLEVRGYHVFNLVVHLLAGLVLSGVIRRTLLLPVLRNHFAAAANLIAGGVALLWLVHPLLTESVVCVIQRNELLVGLFYLLTLYCFIRSVESPAPGRWQALAVGSCLLGMASKEVMVTAPLLVLLHDRTFVAGSFREAWRRRARFYSALAATWLLLAWLVSQNHNRDGIVGFGLGLSSWSYLLTQCQALTIYLKLSFWPHPLVVDYGAVVVPGLAAVWPQAVLVVTLLLATLYALGKRPALGFIGAWFFVILAPSSSFVPLTTQTIAEHRMYLPLAAVSLLVVLGLHALSGRRTLPLCAALAAGLGWLTVQRNEDYRSELTLWSDTIAKAPHNARAYASLAGSYARDARWPEAIENYQRAIELHPDFADAQNDLGLALGQSGRPAEAIPHQEEAARLKPGDPDIRYNLANAYAAAGRLQEAAEQFAVALRARPAFAEAHTNLGDVLLKLGRQAEALAEFTATVQLKPNDAGAQTNLARVMTGAGLLAEALPHYEKAAQLAPDSAEAQNQLGLALVALTRTAEALPHYQAAVQLNPGDAAFRVNWAGALLESGRVPEAVQQYREALRINPGAAGIHYNLGNALLQQDQVDAAVTEYEQALRLQPDLVAAHHNLALALVRAGRPAEAIPHYEEVLRQMPGSATVHHNLALALAAAGRRSEAIAQEEEASRLESRR
jgi:protein O-mannosyl-transferase